MKYRPSGKFPVWAKCFVKLAPSGCSPVCLILLQGGLTSGIISSFLSKSLKKQHVPSYLYESHDAALTIHTDDICHKSWTFIDMR